MAVGGTWCLLGTDTNGVVERSRKAEDLSWSGPNGVLKRPREAGVMSRAGSKGLPRRPWRFLTIFFRSSADMASRFASSSPSFARESSVSVQQ
jgi:hypothetical protein